MTDLQDFELVIWRFYNKLRKIVFLLYNSNQTKNSSLKLLNYVSDMINKLNCSNLRRFYIGIYFYYGGNFFYL